MTTDAASPPRPNSQILPSSAAPAGPPGTTHPQQGDTGAEPPMSLDLVELELALDLNGIAGQGFCDAVQAAAAAVNGEFLFDLPSSGLSADAQRIAVVCLSRDDGGRFALVLLNENGDRARTVEPDDTTAGIVQFAKAFVAVLEKL